jgi:hypothetical protein
VRATWQCAAAGPPPGKLGIQPVQLLFEPGDERIRHGLVAGQAEFAAELEEIVLYIGEHIADVVGHGIAGQDDADGAVGFVDRAVGLDAQVVLGDA